MSLPAPSAVPLPLPVPHPECTSARNSWIAELENSDQWKECENRPWANLENRQSAGCIGNGERNEGRWQRGRKKAVT